MNSEKMCCQKDERMIQNQTMPQEYHKKSKQICTPLTPQPCWIICAAIANLSKKETIEDTGYSVKCDIKIEKEKKQKSVLMAI